MGFCKVSKFNLLNKKTYWKSMKYKIGGSFYYIFTCNPVKEPSHLSKLENKKNEFDSY